MRDIPFVNESYYHIYNRGALKQPIFFEKKDYLRFLHDLWKFNDVNPTPKHESGDTECRQRETLVSILAWCLIPNHFHLFVKQKMEGGVSLFMRKLGDGYTKYINKKYDRSGHLFQGRFGAKHIDSDAYYLHISRYIHCNALDLFDPNWRHGLDESKKEVAREFLEEYPWSSYKNWIGKSHFPEVVDQEEINRLLAGMDYQDFLFEHVYDVQKKYPSGVPMGLRRLLPDRTRTRSGTERRTNLVAIETEKGHQEVVERSTV